MVITVVLCGAPVMLACRPSKSPQWAMRRIMVLPSIEQVESLARPRSSTKMPPAACPSTKMTVFAGNTDVCLIPVERSPRLQRKGPPEFSCEGCTEGRGGAEESPARRRESGWMSGLPIFRSTAGRLGAQVISVPFGSHRDPALAFRDKRPAKNSTSNFRCPGSGAVRFGNDGQRGARQHPIPGAARNWKYLRYRQRRPVEMSRKLGILRPHMGRQVHFNRVRDQEREDGGLEARAES